MADTLTQALTGTGAPLQKEGPLRFKASNPGGSIETYQLNPGVGSAQTIAGWKYLMEPFGYKFIEEIFDAPGSGVGPTGQFVAPPTPTPSPLAAALLPPSTGGLQPLPYTPPANPNIGSGGAMLPPTSTSTQGSYPAPPPAYVEMGPSAGYQPQAPAPPSPLVTVYNTAGGSMSDTAENLKTAMAANPQYTWLPVGQTPWQSTPAAAPTSSAMMPDQRWTVNLDGTGTAPPPYQTPTDNIQLTATPSAPAPLSPPGAPAALAQALTTPTASAISPWAITDTPQPRPEGDVVLLKNQDGKYNWVKAGGGFQSGKSYEIKRTPDGKTYWAEAQLEGAPPQQQTAPAQQLAQALTAPAADPVPPAPPTTSGMNAASFTNIDINGNILSQTPGTTSRDQVFNTAPAPVPTAAAPPPSVAPPVTPPAPLAQALSTVSGPASTPLRPPETTPVSISPSSQNSGTLTQDEYRQLVNSGTLAPDDSRPVVDTFGNVQSDPSRGNQNAQAAALPKELSDALMQLIQEARNQGLQGQEAYTGVQNDLRSFLDFNRQATTQNMGRQDELINSLMAKIGPGLDSAIGGMNEATGLSPEAMAALTTGSSEDAQRNYQGNVSQLKTELARRGAAGGLNPAALDEIVRGYGPLMADRDRATAEGQRAAILANEDRKFESLGLNRQTAMQGLNTAAGLTGTLGSVYNPGQFLGASSDALSGLTGIVGAQNAQATDALRTAGGLASTLAESQPGSFSNLLKSALLSTGTSALTDLLTGGSQGGSQGGNNSLVQQLINLAKGSGGQNGPAETDPDTGAPNGSIPGVAGAGLVAAIGAAAPLIGAVAGLIQAGRMVAAGIGQGRDVATEWVEKVQNPFGRALMAVVDGFNADKAAGRLTPTAAAQGLQTVQGLWASLNQAADEFSGEAPDLTVLQRAARSNYKTVVEQMRAQLGPLLAQIQADMQRDIAQLGGQSNA